MALEGVVPIGRQLVDQLLAPHHGEGAGHADVVQVPVVVVEPQQQRADHATALVPPKPGDDTVGRALVLDLQHHPLILAVVQVSALRDYAVEAGAFEASEPVVGHDDVRGQRRDVHGRLELLAEPCP